MYSDLSDDQDEIQSVQSLEFEIEAKETFLLRAKNFIVLRSQLWVCLSDLDYHFFRVHP